MKKRFVVLTLTVAIILISGCSAVNDTADRFLSQMASGSAAPASTAVSGSSISVCFPRAGQDAEEKLIEEIKSAKSNLDAPGYVIL